MRNEKMMTKAEMKSSKGGIGPGSPKDICDIFGKKGGGPQSADAHLCCSNCIYKVTIDPRTGSEEWSVVAHCYTCGKH